MAFNTILYLVGLASAIWVIYDVFANNKKLSDGAKVLWTVGALVFSIVTAIIYYFTQKK